jgi:hypothetical protein
MAQVSDARERLARRLRELREQHWPEVKITQGQLASALSRDRSVSVPLISSWESPTNPKIPPSERIDGYAAFFATVRSVADPQQPRLLRDEELTEAELAAKTTLATELSHLRAAAYHDSWPAAVADPPARSRPSATAEVAAMAEEAEMIKSLSTGLWRFSDARPITIVCAQLPAEMLQRVPYSDPRDPDYVALTKFADLDAFVELHGHIRAANPGSKVDFRTAEDLRPDDYTTHLVSLGGVDWNHATRSLLNELALPVAQVADWDSAEGPYFEAAGEAAAGDGPTRFYPVLEKVPEKDAERKMLREDVAMFARAVNPFNGRRTVTICNGMYASGTFGAVRALTDARFRDRNASYVQKKFDQGKAFCIVTRVRVERGAPITPDWTNPYNLLFEWMSEP